MGGRRVASVCGLFLIIFASTLNCVRADDAELDNEHALHGQIYTELSGTNVCVKLVNQDGPIGCDSSFYSGTTAPFSNYIASAADLAWFLSRAPHDPYLAVVAQNMYTTGTVNSLLASGKVEGLLVVGNATRPAEFSPASEYPNQGYGLYEKPLFKWNPQGNGFNLRWFNMPMVFLTNTTDMAAVRRGALLNSPATPTGDSPGWPLWGARMKWLMHAGNDLTACLRRDYCEPLGGRNVWATVAGLPRFDPAVKSKTPTTRQTIMVTTAMDSNALFHDLAFGADADASGMAVLLGVAGALGTGLAPSDKAALERNVLFVGHDGEYYGYIGSSSLAYNMEQSNIPVPGVNVTHVLDIQSVASPAVAAGGQFFHTEPADAALPAQQALVAALKAAAASRGAQLSDADNTADVGLPPTALQRYIKQARAGGRSVAGVAFTDHRRAYTNAFAQSVFDTYPDNVAPADGDQYGLCALANTIAETVYTLAAGEAADPVVAAGLSANCTRIHQYLECFSSDWTCPLFKELVPNLQLSAANAGKPQNRYVSVYRVDGLYTSVFLSALAVESAISKVWVGNDTKACAGKQNHFYLDEWCYNSTQHTTNALSPAFDWDGSHYYVKDALADGNSQFTESNWDNDVPFLVEVFLVPSYTSTIVTLVVGFIVLAASIAGVYLGIRHMSSVLNVKND